MAGIKDDHPIMPIDASWANNPGDWQEEVNYLYRGYVIQKIGEEDFSAFDPEDDGMIPIEYAWGNSPFNVLAAVNELVEGEQRRKVD